MIITTRNEEKNIANCLESIKSQAYPQEKIDLIVVDNNSIDKTVDMARRLQIRFITVALSGQRRDKFLEIAGFNKRSSSYVR